jgi:hypothetical protein
MITGPDPSRIEKPGLIITAADQCCFLCGEATDDPSVLWSGFSADIFLHAECAVEMTLRLMRDVHEFEHRTGCRLGWVQT